MTHRRIIAAIAVLVTGVLSLTACSSSGGKSGSKITGTIHVFAASSLTGTFNTIRAQFEKKYPGTKVTYNFDASTTLATQITNGDKADVFASASPTTMATVTSAKDASNPENFASNTMEIAVPPSNPADIASLGDLAEASVKVAVCAPLVPCGVVAQAVFTNAKITVKPVAQEPDVASTLAVVESGEVDAGVVYVTDVKGAGSKVKGITIPTSINATTLYPIATLKDAPNSATAAAFKAYVLSAAGQAVLAAAGFAKG